MPVSDNIQIEVTIAEKPYSLQIKASDEPIMKEIVQEVNEKVQQMQNTYPSRDKQDWLALALLSFAAELHDARKHLNQPKDLSRRLEKLHHLVDHLMQ